LNDPYDWNGPKEPIVAATEADMDGALTMEILKHISNQPVLSLISATTIKSMAFSISVIPVRILRTLLVALMIPM
jgi:hypothetical protein